MAAAWIAEYPRTMSNRPFIVGLGGTTRVGSTSERALAVALAEAEALGCDTVLIGSAQLPAEPYDPSRADRSVAAQTLVSALRRADGVIIATPAYHGGISGLVKNAIDFTEDLRGDPKPYFEGRAVGCIVCAEGPQAMGSTLGSLRAIVHALRGWPTPYGAALNTRDAPLGSADRPADPAALQACQAVAREVVQFARWVQASRG
jgi:FMN reductase